MDPWSNGTLYKIMIKRLQIRFLEKSKLHKTKWISKPYYMQGMRLHVGPNSWGHSFFCFSWALACRPPPLWKGDGRWISSKNCVYKRAAKMKARFSNQKHALNIYLLDVDLVGGHYTWIATLNRFILSNA